MSTKETKKAPFYLSTVNIHRLLLVCFSVFTIVSVITVFGLFDTIETRILSEPKDYKAEEQANRNALNSKSKDYEKFFDENAEQFISDVVEEEEQVNAETTKTEETSVETEAELEGEEF